jgi:hypothetical protein
MSTIEFFSRSAPQFEQRQLDIIREVTLDPEAVKEVQRVTGLAFADARELRSRRRDIAENPNLSEAGRTAALARLEAQRETDGKVHLAAMEALSADKQTEAQRLIEAADRGLEAYGKNAYVLKHHVSDDPRQLTLDGEARNHYRSMDPAKFRELYQQWVIADDPRARVAEADPTGLLVSPRDREWARNWRVEHSEQLPKLNVVRAQIRALSLALETLRLEFAGSDHAR